MGHRTTKLTGQQKSGKVGIMNKRLAAFAGTVRRPPSREQLEIKRLRGVLHAIADSQPWEHMDVDKTPELTNWICDTCRKARVGCYPQNAENQALPRERQ